MTDRDNSHLKPTKWGSIWTSRRGLVLLAFLGMGGTLLFTEHRAHVLVLLPWLFLLACPLLHMFGHGGHGGHSSGDGRPSDPPGPNARGPGFGEHSRERNHD